MRALLSNPRNGAKVFEMATKNPIGNYLEGERELPYEELFLAPERKPFYKRFAKYIAPPLAGMMLAGCATTRFYERVETLPDEVDVLNIDTRPQGAEVIYDGKSIGKTPMQVTVRFNLKNDLTILATEKGGKIIEEKIYAHSTFSKPSFHEFTLYVPGYFEREVLHKSDGKSNGGNYFEILRENGNKPLIHQEQNVIIKQEGKLDKIEIK